MPVEASGPAESPSLDVELALTDSETKYDDDVPKINTGDQDEGQAEPNPDIQDEGQAGPNSSVQDEGQAGSNPGDAAGSQPQSRKKPGKTNAEAEVQSMVSVPIHQDTSSVPPITTPVIDLTTSQSGSPLPTSSATTSTVMTTTTILPPPPQPQQITADPTLIKHIYELEQHMANLLQYNLALEERLDKHGSRLYKLDNLNIPQQVSKAVDEIVTDAINCAMQAPLRAHFSDLPAIDMKEILQQRMFKDKSYEAHEDHKKLYDALEKSLERDYSDQLLSDQEEARQKKRKRCGLPRIPFGSSLPQPPPLPPPMGASGAPGSKALSSSKSAATVPQSMAWTTFDTRYESGSLSRTQELSPTDSLIPDDIPDEQMEECYKLLTDQVDWTNPEGDQGSSPALSISKMKASIYLDFGLKLLVPKQMWIEDVCTYDISTKYGISHWWFNRLKFDIDKHDSLSRQKEVRSHMRILSVVRVKACSRYGYDYLSEILLRISNLQEHTIAEKDFKNLHPSDFEDVNLLPVQGYEFKHDYTIIVSPRAVVFSFNNNERKIMRSNEIYKFSDGTLTRILEALAYKVKEFKVKQLNPGHQIFIILAVKGLGLFDKRVKPPNFSVYRSTLFGQNFLYRDGDPLVLFSRCSLALVLTRFLGDDGLAASDCWGCGIVVGIFRVGILFVVGKIRFLKLKLVEKWVTIGELVWDYVARLMKVRWCLGR
nr:hypothetical protein [Tanacetum cinerariifolium]